MPDTGADGGTHRRFLTFRVEERLYALPAEDVAEVIRQPTVARVPQGPKSLMGLANLRGAVLPVASVRALLGRPEGGTTATSRAIVLDGRAPVALAVDAIGALVSVEAGRIETGQAELSRLDGEDFVEAFDLGEPAGVAKVLDVRRLLAAAFVQREQPQRTRSTTTGAAGFSAVEAASVLKLVTFEVAGQEFALPLGAVSEIISAPQTPTATPHGEDLVLGVMAYRDRVLPLLSLRGLLGFAMADGDTQQGSVVVTQVGGALVGLVADLMRAILSADPAKVEPTPPMLAARIGGEARVKAIYRADEGRRLVSILSPEQLFREDVMQRLGEAAPATEAADAGASLQDRQFLVFSLGENEFGLPIEAIQEVARVPDRITRIPKTPKFLEGVTNMRGEVLPVIDQRRRFDMAPASDETGRRMIVLATERLRAGVIVDGVSEVLRCAVDSIGEAPDLAGEAVRLVNGVVNLEASGRMILLLDPAELLTRTERGLLDAFNAAPEL